MKLLKGLRVEIIEKKIKKPLEQALVELDNYSFKKQAEILGTSSSNIQNWRLRMGLKKGGKKSC